MNETAHAKRSADIHKRNPNASIAKKDSGIRYKCEFCPQVFTMANNRYRHTLTHTGVYRFTCVVCGKGFHRNENLNRHYKTHR